MKYNAYFHFTYFQCKNLLFTAVNHIFRIFTGVLLDYFLLNSANTQNLRKSLNNCKVKLGKRYIINWKKSSSEYHLCITNSIYFRHVIKRVQSSVCNIIPAMRCGSGYLSLQSFILTLTNSLLRTSLEHVTLSVWSWLL
jgi:hypothetical protein